MIITFCHSIRNLKQKFFTRIVFQKWHKKKNSDDFEKECVSLELLLHISILQ